MQQINNKNLVSILKIITISIPVMFLMWLIGKYAVNVIFWDDLEPVSDLINIKNTGKIDWSAVLALHNEHRLVIPRVFMLIIGALTHYNTKVIMFMSAILISVGYFVFIRQTVNKTKSLLIFNCLFYLYYLVSFAK